MAIIKKNELKQIEKSKIDEKIVELKKELMKFNSQRAVGSAIENPGRINLIKRTIAKLLTIKNNSIKETKEVRQKV